MSLGEYFVFIFFFSSSKERRRDKKNEIHFHFVQYSNKWGRVYKYFGYNTCFFWYQKGSYPLTLLSKKNPKNVLMWPIRSNPQKRAPLEKKVLDHFKLP